MLLLWRKYYFPVGLFCAALIAALGTWCTVTSLSWIHEKQKARAYLTAIEPRLEEFHRTNGRYPDALSELPALPPVPAGLVYSRDLENDGFFVDFHVSYEYHSVTGQWVDDY